LVLDAAGTPRARWDEIIDRNLAMVGLREFRDKRPLELSGGTRASVHVALATSVCVSTQARDEFEELLARALAVDLSADPDQRLANRLAQARAQRLLAHIDDLFLPPLE
ncbi:MAG: TRAP transporter TatT component family protein, partial [Planctomycetota bacterium]